MNVLSLNPGSSSLKFALHSIESVSSNRCLLRGAVERHGNLGLSKAVKRAVEQCQEIAPIEAVGCRVVHGGSEFSEPTLVDEAVLAAIRAISPLAPLHNAQDVETIEAARQALGDVPVVAVFDTAFHSTLPPEAFTYALPKNLIEQHGLRRYGFHGISYRYVASILAPKAERLIVCHLGNGASICAIKNGKSIDTSMGMTPLEGLVMGTRSGDVDPGLILFLEREKHIHMRDLDRILNSKSGLAGLSGLSGDVRELESAAAEGNESAELALEVFAYRVAKYIGAYAVALEGLDALAFSGGIGEHSASMRARVCRRLGFLGVHLGSENQSPDFADGVARIGKSGSVPVWAVKTDEERQIAIEVSVGRHLFHGHRTADWHKRQREDILELS